MLFTLYFYLLQSYSKWNFFSWPSISSINFKKLLPTSIATEKGHLEQERKNLQSTKVNIPDETDYFPPKETKCKECIFKLIEADELNEKSYLDLCGRFPYTSSRGSKYILVVYDHDSNLIEGIPLKTRNAKEITEKWETLYNKITKNTLTTKYWILDNEASKLLKDALQHKNKIINSFHPTYIESMLRKGPSARTRIISSWAWPHATRNIP